jgi:dephospho-CoA kinase/nicotinic acid mononucleotide adenylyltransferase
MSNATFTFGRFNPPTEAGHGKLVAAVQQHAKETGGQHYVFPTRSQDKKKNPMSHEDKVSAMRRLFPKANVVSHEGVKTVVDAMKHLEKQGHTHVTMVVGSDRVEGFHKLLNDYRAKEYPKIKKVSVVSAGQRDPDAEGAEGMSASKLRGLVASGNKKEFVSHYSNPKLGAEIHDKVKAGMQMKESVDKPIGIFLLGGPGSGKDYVLNNIFSRFDLTEVQADQILHNASSIVESNQNIVINGAMDSDKIEMIKTILENYEFDYVHVSVTNKVSRTRNSMRDNPLVESKRIEKFLKAEKLAENYDCFHFNNSINLIESNQMEQIMFAGQIEHLLERLVALGLPIVEKVARDKESGLPKKYVAGLSKATAKARAAHWSKTSKMSDRDPKAYEPAPGDATAKTKESKYTKKYHAMYGEAANPAQQAAIAIAMKKAGKKPKNEEVEQVDEMDSEGYRGHRGDEDPGKGPAKYVKPEPAKKTNKDALKLLNKSFAKKKTNEEVELEEGAADTSLAGKAKKSGISVGTLRKVYKRGVAAWNSGHRPGTTPQQWGHARVNSYITHGKTYHTADKDLHEELDNEFEEFIVEKKDDCGCDSGCDCNSAPAMKSFTSFVEDSVDVTPDLKTTKKKGKPNPPTDYRSTLAGMPVVTAKMNESATLEEAVQYHLDNNISITENVFRPGSDMFFQLIGEAKRLYAEGTYTPKDEWEKDLLESDVGEMAMYEGKLVVLDYPVEEGLEEACWSGYTQKGLKKRGNKMVPNCVPVNEDSDPTDGHGIGKPWRTGGGGAVYVRTGNGGVKKVNFSQSGMTKKFMDPGATRSFMARHHCLTNKDKTSASYWACRYPRFFSNSGKTWW